jgi:hypothetical protein
MLTLYSIKDIILNNFEIVEYINKINTPVYNVKYNKSNFLIEPKVAFTNCSYFSNKINKIRININSSNYEENGFNMLLTKIYSGVNKCIFKDINLKLLKLITPVNDSEMLKNIKVFYMHLNKNTLLYEYETKELITPETLKYKRFEIYPVIYSPSLNISSNNIYMNFILKEGIIRITGENDINISTVNEDNVKNAFNKIT